ncbi:MAG: Peroxide-responsive repressor PerR [Firmicutes bacterium ADurb.Bin248]|nr:MAG: Peroxide-responsive repressor PerR [Firmicutes bacterium ADurb.Bin248]HOG01678.1 transcriptional repressor [Clostridia bacterium]HPK17134.1 transcriptional repressor [Clostridia bacterium]
MIYSRQREVILGALRSTRSHPTAEELYSMIKPENPGISLATVYRDLNQLAAHGMILRIHAKSGPDRFDGNTSEHYHAVCSECGRTVDIFTDDMPDVCAAANGQDEIQVSSVLMLFAGVCKQCRESQQDTILKGEPS